MSRHRNDHRKLGRKSEHLQALLRNMVVSLIEHGRIKTTIPKAKEARRYAEKCITLAKKAVSATEPSQALHYRRLTMSALHNKDAVKRLVEVIAPTYKDRQGGYTRILRAGFRLGDHSPIALFELV